MAPRHELVMLGRRYLYFLAQAQGSPGHPAANAVRVIGEPSASAAWPWPAPRLSYANAAIAEAVIVAGGDRRRGRSHALPRDGQAGLRGGSV